MRTRPYFVLNHPGYYFLALFYTTVVGYILRSKPFNLIHPTRKPPPSLSLFIMYPEPLFSRSRGQMRNLQSPFLCFDSFFVSLFFARSFRCNVCKRKKEWARLRTKMGFCQTYTPKWYHFGCTGMGIGGVCYCAVGRKWYFLEQQGTSFLASVFPAFPCLKLPIHRFLSGEKRRICIFEYIDFIKMKKIVYILIQ